MVFALVAGCATTPAGFAPPDGSVDAAKSLDAAADGTSEDGEDGGSTTPPGDSGTQDSETPQSDAGEEASDSMAPESGGPTDGGSADTTTVDAPVCSVGAGADYQASCTGCSISATCLLTCTSCTTDAQTQNPNPSLQLPCPGTMAVQNTNGVLTCS
jgi:hypothetical protein